MQRSHERIWRCVGIDQEDCRSEMPISTGPLAFESTRDGLPHIYVANANGSSATRIVSGGPPCVGARWRPHCVSSAARRDLRGGRRRLERAVAR